jgi:hypothetical protein
VRLGGLTFDVEELGPGESQIDSLWRLDPGTLFVGDVVYNGMHAYLADGHWEQWLATLSRLERELPVDVTLYVGHGPPAGMEQLAAQRHYIERFVAAVDQHADAIDAGDHAPVVAALKELLISGRCRSTPMPRALAERAPTGSPMSSATGLSVDQLTQDVCVSGVPRGLFQEVREDPSQVGVRLVVHTGTDGVEIGRCDNGVDAPPRRTVAIDGAMHRVRWTDVVIDQLTLQLLTGEALENPQRFSPGEMLDDPQKRRTRRDG